MPTSNLICFDLETNITEEGCEIDFLKQVVFTLLYSKLSTIKFPKPSFPPVATSATFNPSRVAFTATFVGEPPKKR